MKAKFRFMRCAPSMPSPFKTNCGICGKRVMTSGMAAHAQAVHGITPPSQAPEARRDVGGEKGGGA